MRAERSASPRMICRPRAIASSAVFCELLGLHQLVLEVARLVLEPLALRHVAHQGRDADHAVGRAGIHVRRHLDPDRGAVGAPEAQQVVRHGAVAREPLEEGRPRLRVDEPLGVEGPHVGRRRLGGVAQHQPQVGIGRPRDRVVVGERPEIHAFLRRLEQPGERLGAGAAPRARALLGTWTRAHRQQ
jgi:hypothetical protein